MKNWWGDPGWDDRDTEGVAPPAHVHGAECCVGADDDGKWCEECLELGIHTWLSYYRKRGGEGYYAACPLCAKRRGDLW